MSDDAYPGELPPVPDPMTGEPRPPEAPSMWSEVDDPDLDVRRRPTPPEGEGPVLEWYRDSLSYLWKLAVFSFFFMAFLVTIIAWGIWWMGVWYFWLIMLAFPAVIYWSYRGSWVAAGALWFASQTGWVRLYELTKVKLAVNTTNYSLELSDSSGRAASAQLRKVQSNARLWDLVYNGIVHSVATREVETNHAARVQILERQAGGRHRA